MAYLVSISFSTPLCAPHTSLKRMYWEKTTALAGLSRKATARTGTNHLAPCSPNRGLFSVNLSCHRHLAASSKHLDGTCLDVTNYLKKIKTAFGMCIRHIAVCSSVSLACNDCRSSHG